MSAPTAALREASELFAKILAATAVRRLLDRDGHKMPQLVHDKLTAGLLGPEAIEKIAADGFETCVRALGAIGDSGVTIHECSPERNSSKDPR